MALPLTDIATAVIGGLTVILIVLTIIYVIHGSKEKGQKDTFTVIPDGAHVNDVGAINAPSIYTNGLIKGDPQTLVEQAKTGTVNDTSCMIMGAVDCKDDINKVWQNQCAIQTIDDRARGGFQSTDDIKAKAQYLSANNNCQGMFKRDGTSNCKLYIDKYATVGVIDEKYKPYRDRQKQLQSVGTVIIMPGFQFDNTKSLGDPQFGVSPVGGVGTANIGIDRHKKRTIKTPVINVDNKPQQRVQTNEEKVLSDNGIIDADSITNLAENREDDE